LSEKEPGGGGEILDGGCMVYQMELRSDGKKCGGVVCKQAGPRLSLAGEEGGMN